jgi:hypothetical protein
MANLRANSDGFQEERFGKKNHQGGAQPGEHAGGHGLATRSFAGKHDAAQPLQQGERSPNERQPLHRQRQPWMQQSQLSQAVDRDFAPPIDGHLSLKQHLNPPLT